MLTCERCGRPYVDAMTLNSTGGIDKMLCYREETGSDKYCDQLYKILKEEKKRPYGTVGGSVAVNKF